MNTQLHSFYSTYIYSTLQVVLLVALSSIDLASQEVLLSLEMTELHNNTVIAHIKMKSASNTSINIGNQNIRLFYNSAVFEIEEKDIKSLLCINKYSSLQVTGHSKYSSPTDLNYLALSYPALGFINFNVSLIDDNIGGEVLSDEWQLIYSLTFNIKKPYSSSDIMLAMPRHTSHLATAYIEISEWINPTNNRPMQLTLENNSVKTSFDPITSITENFEVSVGPNPAIDFIYIMAEESLVSISIFSTEGKRLIKQSFVSNEDRIDVSNLISGHYIMEIVDISGRSHVRQIFKS